MAKTVKGRNGGTLHPVQKGEVKNPKGRGKGTPNHATVLKKWMATMITAQNPVTKKAGKMSVQDAMVVAMIGQALGGSVRAYTALIDRLEGKPRQMIEIPPESEVPAAAAAQPGEVDYDALPDEVLQAIVNARKQEENG